MQIIRTPRFSALPQQQQRGREHYFPLSEMTPAEREFHETKRPPNIPLDQWTEAYTSGGHAKQKFYHDQVHGGG